MMQPWFPDAKLGIFIHYGIYAVKGIPESWSFYNDQISHADYMAQLEGFTASKYDPEAWAELFERVGARYAVLTTKHHDGVALWDTHANDLSVVQKTPAKRDLIRPYVEALRRHNLKVGLYYSHLDWTHPDYATVLPPWERDNPVDTARRFCPFNSPSDRVEKPERWENFLRFHRKQLEELCTEFGQIDLLWFDGDWERSPEQFRMKELRDQLHAWQPEVILNSRMLGYGDYATPEQGVPMRAPSGPWEFCVTINDSWGYQAQDHNHKSVRQLVRMFAETVGMGGNMLLDIGPYEDGSLQPEQVERLEGLGDWNRKHSEALFGTVAGLPPGHFYGASTLTKDLQTLYLFFFDRPIDQIAVKGIRNEIRRATVVGSGRELSHRKIGGAAWEGIPGVLWVDVPGEVVDENATVVKLELDGPLDLYEGAGRS